MRENSISNDDAERYIADKTNEFSFIAINGAPCIRNSDTCTKNTDIDTIVGIIIS